MYIVNTSFVIEPAAHGRWYDFFTEKFIPFCRAQGFDNMTFTRVMHQKSDGHYTYSLQIHVNDIEQYQQFLQIALGEYSTTVSALFGEQVLHFTTLLKKIEL